LFGFGFCAHDGFALSRKYSLRSLTSISYAVTIRMRSLRSVHTRPESVQHTFLQTLSI
jgi:hypothetical protein